MPLVSVIVPNYNHERFLAQRLESIFAQTFTDYEVIILDDASTDGSKAIIESYRYHPVISHIVYNDVNGGSPFKQWRKGLQLAKSDWIWIAESDDLCSETLLAKLVEIACTDETIVLAYAQSMEIDEIGTSGRLLTHYTDKVSKTHWLHNYTTYGTTEIKSCLWRYNTIPNASGVLFKRDALLATGEQYASMRLLGDWLLWVEILKSGKIAFVAEPLNFFRTHGATTRIFTDVQKVRTKFEEEYLVAKTISSAVKGINFFAKQKRLLEIAMHYCTLYTKSEIVTFLRRKKAYEKSIPLHLIAGLFFIRWLKRSVAALGR